MKIIVSIILLFSLSCQCLAKFGIIAWYQLNKEYIAKNLCENRAKPQLKCCGKCILNKKLSKVDEPNTSKKHSPSKTDKIETVDCVIPMPVSLQMVFFQNNPPFFLPIASAYHHLHSNLVFHPPSLTC